MVLKKLSNKHKIYEDSLRDTLPYCCYTVVSRKKKKNTHKTRLSKSRQFILRLNK